MNPANRESKIFLKNFLCVAEAEDLIFSLKIKSPEKECLISMINGKEGFAGCDYVAERFGIHISYWTFVRNLKKGLESFRKAKIYVDKTKY